MADFGINPAHKTAVLDIINDKNCTAAKDVYKSLYTYRDLVKLVLRYSKVFDCDPDYLADLLAVFDDNTLMSYGIYHNKSGLIEDPTIVNHSLSGTTILVDNGSIHPDLEITGESLVQEIQIKNNTTIDSLVVTSGSKVALITIDPGSCINTLVIKSIGSPDCALVAEVGKIDGECVKNFDASPDSIFNGVVCSYIAT